MIPALEAGYWRGAHAGRGRGELEGNTGNEEKKTVGRGSADGLCGQGCPLRDLSRKENKA